MKISLVKVIHIGLRQFTSLMSLLLQKKVTHLRLKQFLEKTMFGFAN